MLRARSSPLCRSADSGFVREVVQVRDRVIERHHHQRGRPLLVSKTLKWKPSRAHPPLWRPATALSGCRIIGDVAPSSPMMPLWRSCRARPPLPWHWPSCSGWNWLASVSTTSLFASGISTGPRLNSGCPKASTLAVVVGHRAEGADPHIAIHQTVSRCRPDSARAPNPPPACCRA